LPEPDIYLVVALSGRALAAAVRRSGRRAVVLDLFGDTDMRASAVASMTVAGDFGSGFDAPELLAAAERLAPAAAPPRFGFAYSSGLESHPDLLAQLADGRRLCGNAPEIVARTKDPRQFFSALDRLGIPFPAISYQPPANPAGWLMKRVGGSGGSHVEPAPADAVAVCGSYFQRRVGGRSLGVSFLADGRRAFPLGVSEQWAAPQPGVHSYRFGGIMQPAGVGRGVARDLPAVLDVLVREFGLVGLNSLDLMVDGDEFHVLEVNPRPGANLDVFDGADPAGLFGLHVAACDRRLPDHWVPPPTATAMSVLYADRSVVVPRNIVWPDWVADRPAPGARIESGAPVCTVLAAEPTGDAVRRAIATRTAFVFSNLGNAGGAAAGQTAAE